MKMQKDDLRDQLVELIDGQQDHGEYSRYEDDEGNYLIDFWVSNEELADHLIASGVTIQRWIPVSERLPDVYIDEWGDFIPFLVCEKGTEYPFRALFDGKSWGDGLCVLEPTHWMPLPQAPKEVE